MNYAPCAIVLSFVLVTGANSMLTNKIEGTNHMNHSGSSKNSGSFKTQDKQNNPITLSWIKTALFAPEFAAAMQEVWPMGRDAYTPVEMDFLRKFPEVVGKEDYFKAYQPLFAGDIEQVNWDKVTQLTQDLLKHHFIFDTSSWGPEVLEHFGKDSCYVAIARDTKTNQLLGFTTFLKRGSYVSGDIKVMMLAVEPAHQHRGIGRLLTSTILNIDPTITRIFLCTRITNIKAQAAYAAWGFVKDANPVLDHAFNLDHWIFMEYKTNENTTLQKAAATLIVG